MSEEKQSRNYFILSLNLDLLYCFYINVESIYYESFLIPFLTNLRFDCLALIRFRLQSLRFKHMAESGSQNSFFIRINRQQIKESTTTYD